jgi:hypothetical protein
MLLRSWRELWVRRFAASRLVNLANRGGAKLVAATSQTAATDV